MIKWGNISEECGELIKPYDDQGAKSVLDWCCGREIMVAITKQSRGLLCSPLLWIIRARRCSVMSRAHQRVKQLPTVIQEGDLGWVVASEGSEFNAKWAVLLFWTMRNIDQHRNWLYKRINPIYQELWHLSNKILRQESYRGHKMNQAQTRECQEVNLKVDSKTAHPGSFHPLQLTSLVWFPYFEDPPRIFSQPNDPHYWTA